LYFYVFSGKMNLPEGRLCLGMIPAFQGFTD